MKQLGFVRWINRLTCLELHQHDIVNYQISIVDSYFFTSEPHWYGRLLLYMESFCFENSGHCFLIYLKKSMPKFVINLIEDTDNLFSEFLVLISAFISVYLRLI